MQSLQPEQGSFLLQMTLPALHDEHKITKRIIEAIPPSQCGYRPDDVVKSAFDLAWHIVGAERMFMEGIAVGAFDYSLSKRPEEIQDSAAIAAWYGDTFDRNFARLGKMTGDELIRVVDFRGVFQLPAIAFLQFCVKHTVHHRGQLTMYLRPMGAKVPSIYGDSYDTALARKAAEV